MRFAQQGRMVLPGALAALLFVATVGSFLGAWSWRLDLLSHFRPQLVVFGMVCSAVAIVLRSRIALVLSLVLTVVNAVPLAPYVSGAQAEGNRGADAHDRIRVMTFNMHGTNTDLAALRRLIDREGPDVILLEEAPSGADFLQKLEERYPYRVAEHEGIPLDVVFISRWKPLTWSVDRSVARFRSVLAARLCDPDTAMRCLTFIGLHADQPFDEGARRQQSQLAIAARHILAAPDDAVLVMGDLNMTPWSNTFRSFVDQTGLYDTTRSRGISGTWNSSSPLFGLPIDHILIGAGLQVVRIRTAEDLGSDHLPLIAELAFKAR
ncbi:endonuclease/exonuclease/phosphatase family protein [Microvirga rosea]|uniref:endonuclease/exonuclease/phosphatase family protein n=1 Tax=Microvirga rosea TaxID=2715425 RepID=UPI001D0A412E|nr:endonuclease/exonuclease/phosphatase family protein [Microvirga rosea]MCB8819865.1 endonuclease/exonuclease/phosphatase family protein [Microvirga rosea]